MLLTISSIWLQALEAIPMVKVEYWNNHSELLLRLLENPPQFVYNL
jgi:hypothetical protein